MRRNNDPRDHYYVVRCSQCPKWIEHRDRKPIAAERVAHRHAKRKAGHEAYVIDLNVLTVVCRYRFDAMLTPIGVDEIPF